MRGEGRTEQRPGLCGRHKQVAIRTSESVEGSSMCRALLHMKIALGAPWREARMLLQRLQKKITKRLQRGGLSPARLCDSSDPKTRPGTEALHLYRHFFVQQ